MGRSTLEHMIESDASGVPVDLAALDAAGLLDLAADAEVAARVAERRKLRYAAAWARLQAAAAQEAREAETRQPTGGQAGEPTGEQVGGLRGVVERLDAPRPWAGTAPPRWRPTPRSRWRRRGRSARGLRPRS